MMLIPSNATDVGSRKENQDDLGFSDLSNNSFVGHGGLLALVVDGMGGIAFGRESAGIAKQVFLEAYERKTTQECVRAALDRSLASANQAVVRFGEQAGDERSVGSTLTAAVVHENRLDWISVGDTALFILRNGLLRRLNSAHAVEDGNGESLVSSFVGLATLSEVDRPTSPFPLEPRDRILLCSDGLYRTLSDPEIAAVLDGSPPAEAATRLIDAALRRRVVNQDNVTAAVICCEPATSEKIVIAPTNRLHARRAAIGIVTVLFLLCAVGAWAGLSGDRWATGMRQRAASGWSQWSAWFQPSIGVPEQQIGPVIAAADPTQRCQALMQALKDLAADNSNRNLQLWREAFGRWHSDLGCAGKSQSSTVKPSEPSSPQTDKVGPRPADRGVSPRRN
jgi:PPM family protein phosphatase